MRRKLTIDGGTTRADVYPGYNTEGCAADQAGSYHGSSRRAAAEQGAGARERYDDECAC